MRIIPSSFCCWGTELFQCFHCFPAYLPTLKRQHQQLDNRIEEPIFCTEQVSRLDQAQTRMDFERYTELCCLASTKTGKDKLGTGLRQGTRVYVTLLRASSCVGGERKKD